MDPIIFVSPVFFYYFFDLKCRQCTMYFWNSNRSTKYMHCRTHRSIDRPTDQLTNYKFIYSIVSYFVFSSVCFNSWTVCAMYEKEQHMNNKKKEFTFNGFSAWWLTISYAYYNSFHWPLVHRNGIARSLWCCLMFKVYRSRAVRGTKLSDLFANR